MPFKIRTKLTVAFVGIILFIISVVGVIAYYNQKALFTSLHRVEYAYTEREYFSDIRIAVEKTVMAANDYLITGDQKEREAFDHSASEAERLFIEIPYEKVCIRCHPAAKGIIDRFYAIKGKELVEEMKYIKELSESFARIRSKGQEILAIDRPVGSAAGARLMEEMDALYHSETGRIIMSYRGTIRGRVAEAIAAAHVVRSRSWLIMLLASVILASIGLIFSRLYARSFVLPIETMHERADTIARGDFKARVEVKSRDELGQLANAMNEMAEKLDDYYGTLENQVMERTRELRESEDKYRSMIESANDMIWMLDSEGIFLFINNQAEKSSGYTIEEVIGKHYLTFVHPEDKATREEYFKRTLSGERTQLTVRAFGKDGGERILILQVSSAPVYKEGKVVGTVNFGRDTTDLKKAEEKLKASEERFRIIAETAADAIICMKSPGAVMLWNKSAERMFGYAADEVIGKNLHDIIVPGRYREKSLEGLKGFFEAGTGPVAGKTVELFALRRDGSEFPVELSISAMRIKDEWQTAAIVRDITERKEAEEKLKRNLDDLKRMNKMMVDREIRMIELKKENQRLRDEAGKKVEG